jgi:hypothetical protein
MHKHLYLKRELKREHSALDRTVSVIALKKGAGKSESSKYIGIVQNCNRMEIVCIEKNWRGQWALIF